MVVKIPKYLDCLIKSNPHIISGRKNYVEHHIRLLKQINILKKFLKKK
jgi:hypothetical protein